MRRLGQWGLGLALMVCLSGAAVAADSAASDGSRTTATDDSSQSWYSRWFSWGQKAPEKKPAADKERPPKPDLATKPDVPHGDELAAERAREQRNFLRRMQVCDKLEEMTRDPDLLRQIDQLRQRIKMTYAQHTAYLPSGGRHPQDEEVLDKHLGTGSAARRAADTPAYTVHGIDSIGQTASSEEKP